MGPSTAIDSSWIEQQTPGHLILKIYVQPGGSKTEVVGLHDGRLKIKVAAPPVEGAANEELVHYLKKCLKGVARNLDLLRGHTSRKKDVICTGELEAIARVLVAEDAR